MKALTICQPWAHYIVHGDKRVENRTWPTRYRGRIAIHAGASKKSLGEGLAFLQAPAEFAHRLEYGVILGFADLVDCVAVATLGEDNVLRYDMPWLYGHRYAQGPWCWILADVQPLPRPVPAKGALGLWEYVP